MTQACALSCQHCHAEAMRALGRPLPVTVGLLHAAPLISQAFARSAAAIAARLGRSCTLD